MKGNYPVSLLLSLFSSVRLLEQVHAMMLMRVYTIMILLVHVGK